MIRNRVKRLLRETYRLNLKCLENGFDIILVGRRPMIKVKRQFVEKSFLDLIKQAKLIKKN